MSQAPHGIRLKGVMKLGLKGRVALVTGASKGLGRGTAQALADEGARVAISSRSRERIEAAAAEIGARPFVHDSADLDAAPRLVEAVEAELGPIEILVANTGGPPIGDPLAFTREQWQDAYRDLVLRRWRSSSASSPACASAASAGSSASAPAPCASRSRA